MCHTAFEYVKRHDPTSFVEAFNSVMFLAYYDKTGLGKSVEQLRFHRDQRWSRQGKFMTNDNSQKKDTATCVLTLGDTRTLHMQCFKDNFTRDGTGSIKINKPFASELFSLTHGSLFYLDPRDEESRVRSHFDRKCLTYFKHGRVHFGDGGPSLGLALRPVVHTCLVDKVTGLQVTEAEERRRSRKNDRVLEAYLADSGRKKWNELKLRQLYLAMKEDFLGPPAKLDLRSETK